MLKKKIPQLKPNKQEKIGMLPERPSIRSLYYQIHSPYLVLPIRFCFLVTSGDNYKACLITTKELEDLMFHQGS